MEEKQPKLESTVGRFVSDTKSRTMALMGVDLLLVGAALFTAYEIAFSAVQTSSVALWGIRLPAVLIAAILLATWRGLYRVNPRYMGMWDFLNIAAVGGGLFIVARSLDFALAPDLPGSGATAASLLFCFFSVAALAGSRMFWRARALSQVHSNPRRKDAKKAVIVGAGDAGEMILRELSKMGQGRYAVAGFVDDASNRRGTVIHGLRVLGGVDDLPEIVESLEIDEVLIAMPEAQGDELRRIFDKAAGTRARIRTLPSFQALVDGSEKVLPYMRELEVQDLLRRDSITTDMDFAGRYISGERILITGGGGSIGGELARQVAGHTPASLVILGKGEGSIFEMEQELKLSGTIPTPIICDIRDEQGMESVYKTQYPGIVFHAAAHKHVPLMEAVPIEAIRNNVFGTKNTAQLALKNGVKKFIQVSTDKAVNPANMMGATKRVAEMIVASLSQEGETEFSIVRFGNVLGSRGSLVPILKKQIQRGGPVTVTHPDMTRYFMTIPEAVQLIVQAGSMGGNGEIFVLDMGEPVSIVELVKDMIRMHGLVPGQDIELKYIGVRPGEKIHEELWFDEEDVKRSDHEKIHMVAKPQIFDWKWLEPRLNELWEICEAGDQEKARTALMELAWARSLPPVAGGTAS